MKNTFPITIRTPEKTLFEDEIKAIRVTTDGGDIELMANHASLTGTLLFSHVVVVDSEGNHLNFLARNGAILFDNDHNRAALLALYCEEKSEVSEKSAKEYADFIEEQLKEGHKLSEFQLLYLEGERLAVKQQLGQ